jgi:hypothetical protein
MIRVDLSFREEEEDEVWFGNSIDWRIGNGSEAVDAITVLGGWKGMRANERRMADFES